jgi:membrane-bound lytic murein transglycosylase B
MRYILSLLSFLSVLSFMNQTVYARSFGAFLNEVKIQALAKGISEDTLNATLPTIKFVQKSIDLDKKQSEFTVTFEKYQQNQLPLSRIQKAVYFLKNNKETFDAIEQKYQVPRERIVALWAIESNFGQNTGNFHVPSVLATLGYDGRRSALFTEQLLNALEIIDKKQIESKNMIGSWAGAMGQSQFMPSSFLRYAVDYTGDGTADIWRAKADVWASIANYLATEGWALNKPTTLPVTLPNGFEITEKLEKEYRPLSELKAMGITIHYGQNDNPLVKLIAPDRSVNKQTFIVFKNFDVLLHWNRSYFFALTAAKLGDNIRTEYYK